MIKLSAEQQEILLAYAGACAPPIASYDSGDLNYVKNSGLVDRKQNHITDRGAAFCMVYLGYSFCRFIEIHANWIYRKVTTLSEVRTFGDTIKLAARFFPLQPELDLFFKARYAVLLKYDCFTDLNSEGVPPDGAAFLAEMILTMLDSPSIDWRKCKEMLATADHKGSLNGIDNKNDLIAYVRSYLNLKTETGYNA